MAATWDSMSPRKKKWTDTAKKILKAQRAYGITKVGPIKDLHGNHSFSFEDCDGNLWEILDNPDGGYRWQFKQGGDLKRPFLPNIEGVEHWRDVVDPVTNRVPTASGDE